ncbi:hypothetical protein STA3757_14740 [Stanieria sp. NIES-3757]|nr:hypothetical protein STA3757_14740 [Stanieria sp. NIES-3757]
MTLKFQSEQFEPQVSINQKSERETANQTSLSNSSLSDNTIVDKILCSHCQRTATNGIKCQGICVADSEY